MASLNLSRPLAFFDLETTGVNTASDRIVEIAILKVHPGGETESYVQRVNPTIPIPFMASKVHGIYDKDVADKPVFKELANDIQKFLENCDLAGFNSNRFDVPILAEEFLRVGLDFDLSNRKMVDVLSIFHRKEQRNLSAAYKFYCGKELDNAHQAEADVRATYEVMMGQLDKYPDLENDVHFLHEYTNRDASVDLAGKMSYTDSGAEVFTFGKYKGKQVKDVFQNDPSYYNWMMKENFPLQTKAVLTMLKQKYSNTLL